jgi:hypothetical protein
MGIETIVRGARFRLGAALAAAMLLVGFAGCGNSGPEVAQVYGKVTYNGEPVTKGNVSFVPMDPENTSPAAGKIQSDGSYELQTFEPGDGARPGKYRVAVTTITEKQILDYIPKKPVPKPKLEIPEKYTNPDTSDIVVTVESGSNDIPIKLE